MRFSQINVAMRGRFHWCMLRGLSNKAVFTQVYVVVLRPTWIFFSFFFAAFKRSLTQLYAEGGSTVKGSGPCCAGAASTVVRDQKETLKRTQRWWPGKAMKGKIHLPLKKERKTHTHTSGIIVVHARWVKFQVHDPNTSPSAAATAPVTFWPYLKPFTAPRPHTPRPPSSFRCKYQRRDRAGGVAPDRDV